jgi:hypothetical protein
MSQWRWLLAASLVAISSAAQADEVVSIDEIPAAAREAILIHVGTGTLREVIRETGPKGEPVYEGIIIKGREPNELDVWVDAAGNQVDIRRAF